ncbi:hypothetical protein Tco_1056732 [Tanacetum coccineum]|uniref:Uncharacterized protein n=1 Tax=Tanacetum coccineum TaxID=301880 RepID=A0ABQ5H3Z2_9ASTR
MNVNSIWYITMEENEVNALKENGRQLHDEILYEHQIMKSVKMQSQDIHINPVQAVDDSSIVSKNSLIESKNNNALSKSEIETHMHMREEKVDMREALDVGLVVTESINDEEPFAEVQLTAQHNILANEQQATEHLYIGEERLSRHTEQSEPSYDTHLLETIDSNTTPNSTNMCHRGGEIVQGAEQTRISRPRFASKVDEKNDLSKTASPHYLPIVRESAAAKPHQVNAANSSRNNHKESSIPLTRKKQVTFTNNTQKHEMHQKVQQSNVQVIPSTGVSSSTRACGSKPRSNTKNDRILPAKSVNNKKVEDHPRTNKSVWTKVNRVDSGISSKRVVINSNSESVCKTCNKCLNSASHEMCVVNILNSVNATPTVKIVLNKGKQIWQPKGKLSDNSLNKTKQVWKATGKLFANIGYQWRPTGKKFALGELCPLTRIPVTCCSKLDLEEEMAPVRISSGPEPKMMFGQNSSSLVLHQMMFGQNSSSLVLHQMMFGQNSSSLVLHQMMSAQISSGLAPQCLKMFEHSSSSLGLHCQKTFKQISSNLVSQMSQRRLLASLQAPFLKEKKGVRFSALYLQ